MFAFHLTGEEVVTKECFVSVCWRLIPYFLNNWEKQWGAECSSMMFELPHFAFELLVILPIVQVRPLESTVYLLPPSISFLVCLVCVDDQLRNPSAHIQAKVA